MSTFFDRSRTASAVGSIAFFAAYFPFNIVSSPAATPASKRRACFSRSAFPRAYFPPPLHHLRHHSSSSALLRAITNSTSLSSFHRRWASLAAPTALSLGGVWLSDAEAGGAGAHWGNLGAQSSGVTLGGLLWMLLLDAALYAVLGVYLDCVRIFPPLKPRPSHP